MYNINWRRIAEICFATIIISYLAGPYVAAGALVLLGVVTLVKAILKTLKRK